MNASGDCGERDAALEGFYAALLDDDPGELYERAPCGYLSTTPDGTIIKVNSTFLTLSGYDRAALVGRRRFSELLSAGGQIYHETHYAPMLQMHGAAREIALDIVRADGERLPVLVNSVLERDAHGAPVVVRTAVFDATDRREYERELLRAKQRAEESEQRAVLLARTLQQTLIPPGPPHVDGLDVYASYRPAGDGTEVGGDFYDIFELSPGDWVLVVGDVCGKGVEAAVVTALVRYTIRAAAVRHDEPDEVLATVNDVLLRDRTNRFCTVVLVRLHRQADAWTARIACGGHPLPVHARAGGEVELAGRPGTVLGVLDRVVIRETALELRRGDALVLYSDGVTEARRDGVFLGDAGLLDAVARHRSTEDLSAALVDEAVAFQAGHTRDDIVVLAVRVR